MIRTVTVQQDGLRLDAYLPTVLEDLSRSYARRLFDEGRVTLDGKPVKPSFKTVQGMRVTVDIPDPVPSVMEPQNIPLDVVYEDQWLLVVNKPQGMVVHPAAGHRDGTLVNALLAYCGDRLSSLNGVLRPGIVHRIDKDTSGLLLVVKDNLVHADMADRIRRHEVERTYLALTHGVINRTEGTIEAPVGRDPRHRQRMAVVPNGKPARTHFTVLERFTRGSWIRCRLETGRTHQIRVHLAAIGHPLVGDPVYAPSRATYGLSGQALHATRLAFDHPVTGERVVVEAPVPEHLTALLSQWRQEAAHEAP